MYAKLSNNSIELAPANKTLEDGSVVYNYCEDVSLLEAHGYVDVDDNLIDLFNQGKGKIENNIIVDISETPEYIAEQETIAKAISDSEIISEINELDIKRIRAIAEPSEKEEGLTWLEYYTQKIQNLRSQLTEL